jgi:hypothetical protein
MLIDPKKINDLASLKYYAPPPPPRPKRLTHLQNGMVWLKYPIFTDLKKKSVPFGAKSGASFTSKGPSNQVAKNKNENVNASMPKFKLTVKNWSKGQHLLMFRSVLYVEIRHVLLKCEGGVLLMISHY